MAEAMGEQTLFARPDQSVGQSGHGPFSRRGKNSSISYLT